MKEICIRISGGISNQILQYSLASFLKSKGFEVLVDGHRCQQMKTHGGYKLEEIFGEKLQRKAINQRLLDKVRSSIKYRIGLPLYKQYGLHLFSNYFLEKELVDEDDDSFEIVEFLSNNKSKRIFLDGTWLNRRYIYESKVKNILEDLSQVSVARCISRGVLKERLNEFDSVAFHVRKGDYRSEEYKQFYDVCSAEYFVSSLELHSNRGKISNVHIFTDDFQWVKDNLASKINKMNLKCLIHGGNAKMSDFDYLCLMSMFTRITISNSTFSWLAATLFEEKKNVIRPERWFGDERRTNYCVEYSNKVVERDFINPMWEINPI